MPRFRRPVLSRRLSPYLGALVPRRSSLLDGAAAPSGIAAALDPLRRALGTRLHRLFDDGQELEVRLQAAGSPLDVSAFRAELQPACEDIAKHGMPVVSPIASLTPESVTRFLVGGFMEVLRSWMEDPESTDLKGRVSAALDTVNALLGLTTSSKGAQHG